MAAISLHKVAGLELALTHNWNIVMTKLPACLQGVSLDTANGTVSADELIAAEGRINVYAQSADMPRAQGELAQASIRGHVVMQPAHQQTAGMITLQMLEDNAYANSTFFEIWRESIFNRETGVQRPKSEVFLDTGLQLQLLDGRRDDSQVVKTYELLWCCPVDSANSSVMSDAQIQNGQISFQYSSFRVYRGLPSSGTLLLGA